MYVYTIQMLHLLYFLFGMLSKYIIFVPFLPKGGIPLKDDRQISKLE